jgi:cysteine desulfurase
MLGASRDEIIFTSGGTESNNLAIKGTAFLRLPKPSGHLIVSGIEHPAVIEPVRFLRRMGYRVTFLGCDSQGVVQGEALDAAFEDDTFLVSIMTANNEIGTVQQIAELSDMAHTRGALFHTDAAQAIGKIPVNVEELGVDLLSIAGHKFYAPKGVGALYVRRGTPLEPVVHGAGHEAGLRPGTENTPYIVGLGRAAQLVCERMEEAADSMAQLRDLLFELLRDGVGQNLMLNAHFARRLPNTLSVNFPQVSAAAMIEKTPELCASTGAACHSGTTHVSATLAAIGLSPELAQGTMRLSVGWYSTEDEVRRAANLLIAAWDALR